MSTPLRLAPDRLLPADPATRQVARELYQRIAGLPILSPHGHVDPRVLAQNTPFTDPASLFITPDHYVTRLLHADGVPLSALGVGQEGADTDPRAIWRLLCERWHKLAGTASRQWLEAELHDIFDIRLTPGAATADTLYDQIADRLARPEYRPRELFARFRIEVLATTDDPCDDLAWHRTLREDPAWTGRVIPTFRPDTYITPAHPAFGPHVGRLADVTGIDTSRYEGYLEALRARRGHFRSLGATSADHGVADAVTEHLTPAEATTLFGRALARTITPADAARFRGHMLCEMAAMSVEDGLVMTIHPGVLRGHHRPTLERYGPDTGHDIPVAAEYTRALRPLLDRFGTVKGFHLILFTLDETVFSRELAPLAGFYPAVRIGAPWWFLDTPDAIRRWREAITETAGFTRGAGFVDDTRAFCSIPARHDVARRVDAGHLADLVTTGVLGEEEAADIVLRLHDELPREAWKLG